MGTAVDEGAQMMLATDHDWFRAALADHLLDLLVAEDEARFKAHALECEPCGAKLALALMRRDDWWDGAGHLPEGVLLGLADGTTELPADVRTLVDAHLAGCAGCRDDFALMQGDSVLDAGRVREGECTGQAGHAGQWRWGFFGALAGAAAAAAFMIVALPRTPQPDSTPKAVVAPAPTAPAPLLLASPVQLNIPSSPRAGGAADTLAIEASAKQPLVALSFPPLLLASDPICDVTIVDAQGHTVGRTEAPASQLQRAGGVVLDVRAMPPGIYLLRVRWQERGVSSARAYPVRVKVRG